MPPNARKPCLLRAGSLDVRVRSLVCACTSRKRMSNRQGTDSLTMTVLDSFHRSYRSYPPGEPSISECARATCGDSLGRPEAPGRRESAVR